MGNQEVKLVISAEDKTQQAVLSTSNGLKYLEGSVTRLSVQIAAVSQAWNSALTVIAKVGEYIDLGAKAIKSEEAFRAMAASAEVNAERLTAAMKKASDGMIDDSDLMQKAAFAMAQDIDPEKIPSLFEAARVAARKTGTDVESAVDGMVQAIATNMPRSLRQMGMISREQMALLNKAAAEGVTEINLLDLVLANAAVDQAKLGSSSDNVAKQIKRFKVVIQELKEALGGGLIVVMQKLFATFQSLAAGILLAQSTLPKFMEWVSRFSAWVYEKTGQKDRMAAVLKDAKWFDEAYGTFQGVAYELAVKAENNFAGVAPEKKPAGDLNKALADREAAMKSIQAQIDAKKDEEKRRRDAEAAGKAAERLQEQWTDTVRDLNADISKDGLDEFEKKLIEIGKRAVDLSKKFKEIPEANALINSWQTAITNEAAREQAKKDFEDYLHRENEKRRSEKETAAEIKKRAHELQAAGEADIQQQLSELDIAEKLGTAHADTISERIRLLEQLQAKQAEGQSSIDKEKDSAGWYAAASAIQKTREMLAGLQRDRLMTQPPEAFRLGFKEMADKWRDVGKQMYDIAQTTANAMQQAFSDFFFDAMQGKLKSLGDYVMSFLQSVQRAMANALSQQVSSGIISGIRSFFSTGSGTMNTGAPAHVGAGGTTAFGMHSGGIIGREPPTFYRMVPNLAFAGAPRFHGGFAPDEYPAVLQRGEGVFTAGQMRALGKMSGSPQSVKVEIVNEGGLPAMKATDATWKFDFREAVISVVLDAAERNHGNLRTALGGA